MESFLDSAVRTRESIESFKHMSARHFPFLNSNFFYSAEVEKFFQNKLVAKVSKHVKDTFKIFIIHI